MSVSAFVRLTHFVKYQFCNLLIITDPNSFKGTGNHRIHAYDSDDVSIANRDPLRLPIANSYAAIEAAYRLIS